MAANWTTQQVEALAPDASSAKSGKELANPRKWKTLGCTDEVAWGECQGSGKDPYQAQIDLSEPAFRCTCPSRKFPCKHGLGLFLLYAVQQDQLKDKEPPAWVTEWLSSRAKKAVEAAEKQAKKEERAAQPADPAAQAKRAAQRLAKVTAGLDYLETWLHDLVRGGLSAASAQSYGFWETPAARMVDAQAPGLGRVLREMAGIPATGEGWQERLLERLAKLHLLIEGFRRIEEVPPETQADIRAQIGFTLTQEELFASCPEGSGVRDRWLVVGQRVEDEDRFRAQRTWLWGRETGRAALVLHFAPFGQPLDRSLAPGMSVDAELVYFPGAHPLRALVRTREGAAVPPESVPGYATVSEAVERYSEALAAVPWLEQFPVALRSVLPVRRNGGWIVRDEAGCALPLSPRFESSWHLLALTGGHSAPLFGEWDGDHLLPLSLWTEHGFHPLGSSA